MVLGCPDGAWFSWVCFGLFGFGGWAPRLAPGAFPEEEHRLVLSWHGVRG